MIQIFATVKTATFLGGAAVGALGVTALKSETARKLAVSGIAKGILLKDALSEKFADLVDEVEDICSEAKDKAKDNAFSQDDMFQWDDDWDDLSDDIVSESSSEDEELEGNED